MCEWKMRNKGGCCAANLWGCVSRVSSLKAKSRNLLCRPMSGESLKIEKRSVKAFFHARAGVVLIAVQQRSLGCVMLLS